MSEISVYDIVPTPKLADKLIGTSVGGVIEDVTYNFTLQELLQLFIPNIPANTLQGVLDYGNTATQNINLTGTISTTNLTVLATANILNSNLSGNTRVMAGLFDRTNASGTAGQFLRSTGTQVEWFTIPTVIPTLQQVLQSGNTSNISIVLTANITAVTATADTVVSNTSLNVNGVLRDGTAAVGSSNQILSSTGSGVRWVDMPVYNVISPLLYDTPTKTFSIQVANSSQGGYLSAADWINFDGKQDAIILTTTGTSGASTFVGNTLNIPVYTPDLSGYVPISRTLTINGVTYDLSANRSWTIPAGVAGVTATSPLFSSGGAYPNITIQKADSSLNGYLSNVDWLTFNSKQNALDGGTGLVKSTLGTITYITDNSSNWNTAYNRSIISAAVTGTTTKTLTLNEQDGNTITASWTDLDTGLTSVGVSMPSAFSVANSPLTSNGTIAITGSGTSVQYIDGTGALQTFPSLTGFVPYSGATTNVNLGAYNLTAASLIKSGGTSAQFLKADGSVDSSAYIVLGSLTASSPLSYNNTTGDFSISQSGASANGYLSSTDWNTFNNKQVAGNYITSLTGEATGTGPGATAVTLNNASVTAKVLTGVNITGGSVVATDTMLTAFGKLQNQINGLIGSTIYQGVWNASTNTPTLTSSTGTRGYYYIVNVAGNTNLNGITDWQVGDWAIFDGTAWQKVDNTDAVTSVNGFTGAVSLTTDNIAQGTTNLYFANSLARTAVSLTTTGSSGAATYNNTTGVFNIPNYSTALASYLPLTGGTLTGALVIDPANTGIVGLDVASNTVRLRSDSTNPFARQLTTTMNSGTLVKMQAAGYGGTYVTDLGFYTSTSSAINTTPNLYLTGGDNRVGINTDTPAYTLDVVGTAKVLGVLTLGSTISNGTYTYTLPGATGTLALVGGAGVGTVTSVAALTIGTTGTDITSTVANSTTTPVITLNVPTASATNRGALSAADWTTFNSKQNALTNPVTGTGTTNYLPKFTSTSAIGNSAITDDGTNVTLLSRKLVGSTVELTISTLTDALLVNNGSGRGIRVNNSGAGYGVIINNDTASTAIPFLIQKSGADKITFTDAGAATFSSTVYTSGALQAGGTINQLYAGATKSSLYLDASRYVMSTVGAYGIAFEIGVTPVLSIPTSGNVLINTTTDAGYKLDVNGTGRFTGALNGTSATFSGTGYSIFQGSAYLQTPASTGLSFGYNRSGGNGESTIVYGAPASGFNFEIASVTSGTITPRLTITNAGAATFSSSVTAGNRFASVIGTSELSMSATGGYNTASYIQAYNTDTSTFKNLTLYGRDICFLAQVSTDSERMRITSGGNVGIGTTSPGEKLWVNLATNVNFAVGGSTRTRLLGVNDANNNFCDLSVEGSNVLFYSAGSERMRITSGGNVGINTTGSSSIKLIVCGQDGGGSNFSFVAADNVGNTRFGVRNDGYTTTQRDACGGYVAEITNINSGDCGGSGVLILTGGRYNSSFDTTSRYLSFRRGDGTEIGAVRRNGASNVAYDTSSDYRLKEDLKDFSGLDKVSKLKVYDFRWKDTPERMEGVLAHELQEVIPYAVGGEKDGVDENGKIIIQGVDYSKLVPILIKAIQEQQDQIEQLKNK
jgi:hypothetical protein